MSHKATLEQVEHLVGQLELQESLRLIARIAERLEHSLLDATDGKRERERMRQARLQLANELLAEVDDVADDSQGKSEAAELIRPTKYFTMR